MRVVLPLDTCIKDICISFSVLESNAEVARSDKKYIDLDRAVDKDVDIYIFLGRKLFFFLSFPAVNNNSVD